MYSSRLGVVFVCLGLFKFHSYVWVIVKMGQFVEEHEERKGGRERKKGGTNGLVEMLSLLLVLARLSIF